MFWFACRQQHQYTLPVRYKLVILRELSLNNILTFHIRFGWWCRLLFNIIYHFSLPFQLYWCSTITEQKILTRTFVHWNEWMNVWLDASLSYTIPNGKGKKFASCTPSLQPKKKCIPFQTFINSVLVCSQYISITYVGLLISQHHLWCSISLVLHFDKNGLLYL